MKKKSEITVMVVHADPWDQEVIALVLPSGARLAEAIACAGLDRHFPGLDPANITAGIWGKAKPAETLLRDGDRVEIYRPLKADPKEARRRRVQSRSPKGA